MDSIMDHQRFDILGNIRVKEKFKQMNTRKMHFISGLTLTIFIGFHLLNHFMSLLGVEAHIAMMDNLRIVYRNPIVETVLLLAAALQIFSGLKLIAKFRTTNTHFFDTLRVWSGLYLAGFLLIHVGAVLTGRFILDLDTNIYFGAAGLNAFPFNLFFIPYYALAILAFFGHIASIHFRKMKNNIFGLSPILQSKLIVLIGFLATLLVLYGLTNGFTGMEIPSEYNILIGK